MRIGYDEGKLEGDWAVFVKIAGYFVNKVPSEDREDFRQNLLVEMAKVKAKYAIKGKPLTEASLMMVAEYERRDYYIKRRYRHFGFNCTRCSIEQRRECQATKLPSDCPKKKAHRIVSLNTILKDKHGDGHKPTELIDLIADTKTIDLAAKLDARSILKSLPKRVVQIGYKIYAGIPLETEEKKYLKRWQKTYPSVFYWSQRRNHLREHILELLRKNTQGMTRSDLSTYLQVPVGELKPHLNQLIERQQVIAVRRENTYGKSRSSLLLIAGAEIPEKKAVKDESILELLRENTQGVSRRDLSTRLQVPIEELKAHLNQLIERQQVIAVRRENTRGRPPSPLLFIAGTEIPEEQKVKTPRDERIRQAHFIEGWSIKRINRELHHDKRTIRRAIQKAEQPALLAVYD
ncbi:hypothetical protein ES705_20066 [subsurface metagenome]|jgi:predicted transcriptional regulator